MKKRSFFPIVLLTALASACATVEVPMTVTHPAELNLSSYKTIAIGDIRGTAAPHIVPGIVHALVSGKNFRVQKANGRNGNGAGTLIVSGNANYTYTETIATRTGECGRHEKTGHACVRFERYGELTVTGGLYLTDASTGTIVADKPLKCVANGQSLEYRGDPPPISQSGLLKKCVAEEVNAFIRMVQPWREAVEARFLEDGGLPALEKGIAMVQNGKNDEAERLFLDAVHAAEADHRLSPAVKAWAWWDIGLLYEYTRQFDKAEEALIKSYDLSPENKYLAEIKKVRTLRARPGN